MRRYSPVYVYRWIICYDDMWCDISTYDTDTECFPYMNNQCEIRRQHNAPSNTSRTDCDAINLTVSVNRCHEISQPEVGEEWVLKQNNYRYILIIPTITVLLLPEQRRHPHYLPVTASLNRTRLTLYTANWYCFINCPSCLISVNGYCWVSGTHLVLMHCIIVFKQNSNLLVSERYVRIISIFQTNSRY